jgi:hypothetical protein
MFNSGRRGKRSNDGYGIISQAEKFIQNEYPIPIINSFSVTDISYNPTGALAANTAGGETILINGSGFAPGATIQVGSNTISVVTYIDQGRLAFTAPAASAGSYTIYVSNSNGGTGILVPGLTYSSVPTFQTNAGSLGSYYETQQINQPIVATGDAPLTYSLLSGSLPTGSTLSSSGVITGTAPVDGSSTTYTFTARAFDAQSQTVDRQFSLTINTDVVTWLSPSSNYVISSYEYAPISNVTASATSDAGYGVLISANTLPAGITLNANTGLISGTNNTVGNTFTRLTATANTTNRSATRDVIFNVNQDVVTWSSPADATQYLLSGGSAISNVSLSATSAAGFGVQYTANALPTGLAISGSTIYGTPTTAETVNTLLTATANTTSRTATRTISWVISLGDVYWKYTTLALNGTTTVTPFITDSSNNNAQLIVGDSRVSNFNPYQLGYYSNYFDGTGQTFRNSSFTNANFGSSNNFTIEMWVYWPAAASGNQTIFELSGSTRIIIGRSSTGVRVYNNNTEKGFTANVRVAAWNHIAMVRNSGTINIYLNGVSGTSYADSTNWSHSTIYMSKNSDGTETSSPYYVSNLRILNGTAAYTNNFTPPSTPLTAIANTTFLAASSTKFEDRSSYNTTLTVDGTPRIESTHPFSTLYQANTQYYSTNFSSSAYVTAPITGGLGTGDFTVEGWVYLTSSPGNSGIYHLTPTGYLPSSGDGLSLSFYNNLWHNFHKNYGDPSGIGSSPSLNRWYHFAQVRSSGTYRVYIDGVQIYTDVDTYNYTSSTYLAIGAYYSSGYPFPGGHISNFRIVRGTALYSGSSTTTPNFTPPTGPLTAIANTVFLGLQSDKLVDNSTNNYTITPSSVTAIKPLAVSPFTALSYTSNTITTYGSSYHLNSTRDISQIYTPTSSVYNVGSSDFTLEFWVNFNDTTSTQQELFRFDGATTFNPYLMLWNSNEFYFRTTETTGDIVTPFSSGITAGRWVHLCVTRSGNNYTIYRNGISVATGTSTGVVNENKKLILGSGNFKGYLSDVRFTKGSVLYTSNFVPEFTRPLTAGANTQLLTLQTNGSRNNNSFRDESSFNNIITRSGNVSQGTFSPYSQTGWSNYFVGTSSQYFTLPTAAATAFGGFNGNFTTIEFWAYQTTSSTGSTNEVIGTWAAVAANGRWYVEIGNGAASTGATSKVFFTWTTSTGSVDSVTTTAVVPVNQWAHIAIVVNATGSAGAHTVDIYVNGTGQSFTSRNFSSQTSTYDRLRIAGNGSSYFNGYLSNLRVVRGTTNTVGYTGSSISVPTLPFIPVTGTVLLTCQDNRFVDDSRNNIVLTPVSTPSVQAFSPFGGITSVPTSYSVYFDGSGDYLTVPGSSNFVLAADYTIEAWIYSSSTTWSIYSTGGSGATDQFSCDAGTLYWAYNIFGGGTANFFTSSDINQWTHIAASRSSGTTKLFKNGVVMATSTTNESIGSTNTVNIGRRLDGSYHLNGYMSNFRIVKGTALYTGAFTPPTSPLTAVTNTLLLTCQNSTLIDNSTNYFTLTAVGDTKPLPFNPFGQTTTTQVSYSPTTNGGSIYFDGTGDKLTVANYPTLGFKANDFTIQCWFYTNVASTEQVIMTNGWAAYAPWLIRIDSGNTLRLNMSLNGGSWVVNEGSLGTVTPGQWYHVAVTRTSGVLRAFTNGVQTYTTDLTTSTLYDGSQALTIGGRSDTTSMLNGYISDAQLINGFSLYRANFVPPVAPATPTYRIGANTGTSTLLLSGTSGGIIDMHGSNNLETVGDVIVTKSRYPYSTAGQSYYFDGTDWLYSASTDALSFGTGDFTVEYWMYSTTGGTQRFITGTNAAGTDTFMSYIFGGSELSVLIAGTVYNPATSIATNTWHHIAITRSSGTVRLFLNGTQVGTNQTITASITNTRLTIGNGVQYTGAHTGYLSDIRITKGVARYTANFTRPTATFEVK